MSITKIALTGGIASGKTYISDFFKKLDYAIIDLDIINKQIMQYPYIIAKLQQIFSNKIIKNTTLDYKKLRYIVFNDKKKLKQLEQLTQPLIINKMQQLIAINTKQIIIIVVPLLYEKNISHYFDKAIVVICNYDIQLQRLCLRDGINKQLAQQIIKSQATNNQRKQIKTLLPTDIITNNNSLSQLNDKLILLNNKIIANNNTKT